MKAEKKHPAAAFYGKHSDDGLNRVHSMLRSGLLYSDLAPDWRPVPLACI